MLMMQPPLPAAIMARAARWHRRCGAFRLTAISRSHCSLVMSISDGRSGRIARGIHQDVEATEGVNRLSDECVEGCVGGEIALDGAGLDPLGFGFLCDRP